MKIFFLIVITLFAHQLSNCQKNENKKSIDSLVVLANKTKIDTQKINLYHLICKKYYIEDPSLMKQFNDKIYALSSKANYTKGIGLYYLNLTDIDYLNGDQIKAIADAEKAYGTLSKTNDVKNRLNAVTYLSYAYYDNLENGKARKLLQENFKLAHHYNDPLILARMYLFYGESYNDLSKIEELKNYKKAQYYYNKLNDINGKSSLLHQIATVYEEIHLYDEALKYLNLAIELKVNKYNYTILLLEKAKLFNKMERYSDAKSIALKNEQTLLETHQKSSSIYWVNKLCISIAYFGLHEYEEAIKNGKSILTADLDNETKMAALNVLSHSYLKLKNVQLSKLYINQSLKLVPLIKSGDIENTYLIKSKVEEALGNYKMALMYNQKYSLLNNSKNEEINKNKTHQLQVDFEVTEKENQIKKLEIASLQKTLNIEKQLNYLILVVFILCIAIISIISFIRIYGAIKRRNKIIEQNNIQLSESNLLIQKSLAEKELLLKEIHHRVKNNLQLVMSLLSIQAREGDSEDINDFLEKGQSRIISMALIHENLYQTDKLDKVNFQDYLINLVDNINHTFDERKIKINNTIIAKNTNFDIQTSIPLGLIINELYCNILKHAFPEKKEGNVTIELLNSESESFQMTISDDGVGLKNDLNRKKTLGLELVHLLVEQLRGTIVTEVMNGTKFIINFKEVIS